MVSVLRPSLSQRADLHIIFFKSLTVMERAINTHIKAAGKYNRDKHFKSRLSPEYLLPGSLKESSIHGKPLEECPESGNWFIIVPINIMECIIITHA